MANHANGGWRVSYSEAVGKQLRRLQQTATRRGQGDEFLAALRQIIQLLRQDPASAGEPLYRLPALGLRMRTIAIAPLLIYFAVSEERPDVYVKSGKLLSAKRA